MTEKRHPSDIAHFDKILVKYLGEFGRYQKFVLFTVYFTAIISACHQLGHVFLAAIPPYWCHIDNCTWEAQEAVCEGFSLDRWACEKALVNYTAPEDKDGTKGVDERQCRVYNVTCGAGWMPNITAADTGPLGTTGCERWDYDQSVYQASIVTDVGYHSIYTMQI